MSHTYMMSCLSKSSSFIYNSRFNNHIALGSVGQNNKNNKDEIGDEKWTSGTESYKKIKDVVDSIMEKMKVPIIVVNITQMLDQQVLIPLYQFLYLHLLNLNHALMKYKYAFKFSMQFIHHEMYWLSNTRPKTFV